MDKAEIHHYKAFGLNIESALPCLELAPSRSVPDVRIRYGAVPDALADATGKGPYYQARANRLLLIIEDVARYLVSDGREIIIERAPGSRDDEVRLYLLGSAFGALLHQRGLLPLHGSAIEVNGGAVVFLGPSGLGKSTLAGTFYKRGYRVMTDDVCVLSISEEGIPVVLPGYPQLKLGAEVARNLGENPLEVGRGEPPWEKHGLPLRKGFCETPLPLRRLYVLTTTETQKFELIPLKGMEKFTVLLNNTYRFCFLDGQGGKVLHFKQCAALTQHAAVSRVIRPSAPLLLDELADLLERDLAR